MHYIARVPDLLALPDEVSEDVSALLLRLERDVLALLQAVRVVLKYHGSCEQPRAVGRAVRLIGPRGVASNANSTPAFATGSISNSALIAGGEAQCGGLLNRESGTGGRVSKQALGAPLSSLLRHAGGASAAAANAERGALERGWARRVRRVFADMLLAWRGTRTKALRGTAA